MITIDLERVLRLCAADDNRGICINCGETAYGIELDGRECECENCGKHEVYGAEELLLRTP